MIKNWHILGYQIFVIFMLINLKILKYAGYDITKIIKSFTN